MVEWADECKVRWKNHLELHEWIGGQIVNITYRKMDGRLNG